MLRLLCPDAYYACVAKIDLDALQVRGIRALILDLDNTLVGWGEAAVPPEVADWIATAKARGFRLCIASNGLSGRVQALADELGVAAIARAEKPRKRSFRRALAVLGVPPAQAAVVGDQLFTDVLGGNRMALYTILINPLSTRELRTTRWVRRMERRVLRTLHRKGLLPKGALAARLGEQP